MAEASRQEEPPQVQVDVWSDVACPWCYVGKRRLEAALDAYDGEAQVTWHSFELDPAAPAQYAGDAAQHLAAKYGMEHARAAALLQQMEELGAGERLELRFARSRGGNTFDAHRVVQLALQRGRQGEMKERLMRAYFTDGDLISDHATLRRLAGEVGLDEREVQEMLAGEDFAQAVRTDEFTAQQLGIDAVPFFIFDRRYAVKGAQSSAHLLEALRVCRSAPRD